MMTLNWLLFWFVPIMGMGSIWKYFLKFGLLPIYHMIDQNKYFRSFASNYIYTRPEHADFFLMSLLTILSSSIFIPLLFYWQLTYGDLPKWLIFTYYCSWVGLGGSVMGTAYSLAHKEV
jgi:hypothetical protein